MSSIIKENRKKKLAKKVVKSNRKIQLGMKRKKAIEKAIGFWENHSVDMSGFKFDREKANAR